MRLAACGVACGLVLASAGPDVLAGGTSPNGLWAAAGAHYERARSALAGGAATPESAQRLYDAGRDLDLALPDATSTACAGTLRSLRGFARHVVTAAEEYDRKRPRLRDRALARASVSLRAVERRPSSCANAPARSVRPGPALVLAPGSGEAFEGVVRLRVPAEASSARVAVDGARGRTLPVHGRSEASFVLGEATRRVERLEVVFRAPDGRTVGADSVSRLTRLPDGALDRAGGVRTDPAFAAGLRSAARAFAGTSASWVVELRSGRHGSWNPDSRFPAASTAKLGVLVGSVRHFPRGAPRDAVLHELEAVAGWSSNLAANRLLRLLGDGDLARGRAVVEGELRRLGAVRSTYPGAYRAGSGRRSGRGAEQGEPPLVSSRVTTARDLGVLLETVHRAATGQAAAVRSSGLRPGDARLVVGLLLRATATGENAGLLGPFLHAQASLAQKNGWISSARHTAAIVYGARGPIVCVLLTYRPGLTLREAQALGARVASLCDG